MVLASTGEAVRIRVWCAVARDARGDLRRDAGARSRISISGGLSVARRATTLTLRRLIRLAAAAQRVLDEDQHLQVLGIDHRFDATVLRRRPQVVAPGRWLPVVLDEAARIQALRSIASGRERSRLDGWRMFSTASLAMQWLMISTGASSVDR